MRRLVIVGGVLGVMALLAGTLLHPWILERSIDWTCAQPTERYLARMRAMGHVWWERGDVDRARHWYVRAADGDDADAMFHLAWMYEQDGRADVERMPQRMVALRQAGQAIDYPTEFRIARANFHQAAEWYRRSSAKRFSPAMNNLGELYSNGALGPIDREGAFRWHLAAALAGNPVGAANVLTYRFGRGTPAHREEADKWRNWTPTKQNMPDLAEPTLARTNLLGTVMPMQRRAELRAAAEKGEPVRLDEDPLLLGSRVRSFEAVRTQLQ